MLSQPTVAPRIPAPAACTTSRSRPTRPFNAIVRAPPQGGSVSLGDLLRCSVAPQTFLRHSSTATSRHVLTKYLKRSDSDLEFGSAAGGIQLAAAHVRVHGREQCVHLGSRMANSLTLHTYSSRFHWAAAKQECKSLPQRPALACRAVARLSRLEYQAGPDRTAGGARASRVRVGHVGNCRSSAARSDPDIRATWNSARVSHGMARTLRYMARRCSVMLGAGACSRNTLDIVACMATQAAVVTIGWWTGHVNFCSEFRRWRAPALPSSET